MTRNKVRTLCVVMVALFTFAAAVAQEPEPTYNPEGTWLGINSDGQRWLCTNWMSGPNRAFTACDGANWLELTPFLAMTPPRGDAVRIGKNEWAWTQVIVFRAPWDADPSTGLNPTIGISTVRTTQVSPDRIEGTWSMSLYGPSPVLPWDPTSPPPMRVIPGTVTLHRVPMVQASQP